jgi:hypothetical protein
MRARNPNMNSMHRAAATHMRQTSVQRPNGIVSTTRNQQELLDTKKANATPTRTAMVHAQ